MFSVPPEIVLEPIVIATVPAPDETEPVKVPKSIAFPLAAITKFPVANNGSGDIVFVPVGVIVAVTSTEELNTAVALPEVALPENVLLVDVIVRL